MFYKRAGLYLSLIILLFWSCNSGQKKTDSSIKQSWHEQIPDYTGYIFVFNKNVKINRLNSPVFQKYISETDRNFLKKIGFQFPFYLYVIQKDDKLRSFVALGLSSQFNQTFHEIDGIYEGVNIFKAINKKKEYFGYKSNDIVYISDSRINLENMIRKKKETPTAEQLHLLKKTDLLLDRNADYNLIQFSQQLKPDIFNRFSLNISLKDLPEIEAYDAIDYLKPVYSGVGLDEEERNIGEIFKGIKGESHEIYQFVPEGFTALTTMSFDDFPGFYEQFLAYFQYQPLIKYTTKSRFRSLISLSVFEENFNKAMILGFEDAMDFIKANPFITTYNNYDIYEIKEPEQLQEFFQPVLPKFKASFFTVIDDYILITENNAYLKQLINSIENRSTLINRKDFQEFSELFPSGAQIENLRQFRLQGNNFYLYKNYSFENNNTYVNLLLQKVDSKQKQEGIEHMLTVSMEDTPIIKPQLVYNHKHKTYRIIYQNQNNELVYKDLSGQELWRKKFDGKIIGKIYPVDLYRNGKIQYTFVTKNKWYVIDRYGRNVEGFPVKFKKDITQSISVFDYDKNRKYRFGIVQGKKFTLFDKEGKKVKGFDYKPKGEIQFPVLHYRIDGRDYLLVQIRDGKLAILDRRGNIRIPVKEKFENLFENWKVYNKKFLTINKENDVVSIDTKGKIKKARIKTQKPVKYNAIPELFAAVTDSQLLINNKAYNIDLGNYFIPFIFKPKNGSPIIFISREDNNKIYAFDSKGEILTGFPIIGQQVLDIKALGKRNYLLSYDSDRNLMIYRFK